MTENNMDSVYRDRQGNYGPPTVCPVCGRVRASERAMKIHHTKTHDEPLPKKYQ